jgi:hypothetical protein
MSAAPALRDIQALFWRLITAPEGVRPALEAAPEGGEAAARVERLFAGDDRVDAVERLDIYANMYFYRLLDCLKEDFAKTLAAIGPARFHNLATDFLLRHPSRHPSLRELGRPLPGFIAAHALAGEYPWLADLARLEWTRTDLFDAEDAAPVTGGGLAAFPPDRAGEALIRLVPAFALLRLGHDAPAIWRALAAAGAPPEAGPDGGAVAAGAPAAGAVRRAAGKRTAVRVWRQEMVVYHRAIDEEEAGALEAIGAGETFARLCQRAAAGRSPGRATARVGRMLQGWLEDGIIAGFDLPALR